MTESTQEQAGTPGVQPTGGGGEEPIPFMQRLLDNPFALLALGVAVPTIFYLVWGIMEIVQIPVAK